MTIEIKKEDAVAFFGSQTALGDFFEIKQSAVSQWGEYLPRGRAYELVDRTNGEIIEFIKERSGETDAA